MTLESLITKINYALRGTDDNAPSFGDDEWDQWVSVANDLRDSALRDANKSWKTMFKSCKDSNPDEPGTVATTATTTLTGTGTNFTDYRVGDKINVSGETVRTIATITSDTVLTVTVAFSNTATGKTFWRDIIVATGVEEYKLHRRFYLPSNNAVITKTDGYDRDYGLVDPDDRETGKAYISGDEPQTVTFYDEIESTDDIVGGSLKMPGYYLPSQLSASTDLVTQVDPYWLIKATAAEIAFSDITYEDKYEDLNGQASTLYRSWIRRNRRGTVNQPRVSPVNVQRIPGFNR